MAVSLAGLGRAAASPEAAAVVPEAVRATDTARLRKLGLHLPQGGPTLEQPWAEPWSRRSWIVPPDWLVAPAPDAVDANALARDLPLLERLMRKAYGGWDLAEQRGFRWERWFADWRAMLAQHHGQRLALAEAFAPVATLRAVLLDNHTTLPLSKQVRFNSSSRSVRLVSMPDAECSDLELKDGAHVALDSRDPGQRVRRATELRDGRLHAVAYMSYPSYRGDVVALRCGAKRIATTPAWRPAALDGSGRSGPRERAILAISGEAKDGPVIKRLSNEVIYARLPHLSIDQHNGLAGLRKHWPRATGQEKAILVDLRDNGGGGDPRDMLEGWLDLERLKERGRMQMVRSCATFGLEWNLGQLFYRQVKDALPREQIEELQRRADELWVESAAGCPRSSEQVGDDWTYRQHRVAPPGAVGRHPRLIVLVDEGCGSDCEGMVLTLSALPEAVVVGVNTFGVAQFIRPGFSVLPHSRVPFRIALGTSDIYGDNRSVDGYGLDVDVLLSTEDDWSPAGLLRLATYFGGTTEPRR